MLTLAPNFYLITLRKGSSKAQALLEGQEELGGKAHGLLSAQEFLKEISPRFSPTITVDIPKLTVVGTSVFEAFIERNKLLGIALSNAADDRIANAFLRADMPFEVLGELRALVENWKTPLAVRSSGLLEDTTQRPFAGVYVTKMIPNNQADVNVRFQKLIEAIKFVWASTFFKIAKDYCKATQLGIESERMAVIIQEVIGRKHGPRFYPDLSGVARSYNFYPFPPAKTDEGVVNLALGLGKTIVDGGKSWIYCPFYPHHPPPFSSIQELLEKTQTHYWVINLGEPPQYDPLKEAEFMQLDHIMTAEKDGVLPFLASTYDPQSERVTMGTSERGPRVLNFAPLITMKEIPFNELLINLMQKCEAEYGMPVEIEFAATFEPNRFGFLQVRPMAMPRGDVHVSAHELRGENVLIASDVVLGNGILEIQDVVYVIPERFDLKYTKDIAVELEEHNNALLSAQLPYVLIVFGRLGTLDPWLGIPVAWGQICGAKVIVEATQDNVRVELSQGSHYFHNIINLGVLHFSMPFTKPYQIRWDWLKQQQIVAEKEFTRHIRFISPLQVKVDGRSGRGVILRTA